jgi:hypothetical protein
VVRKILCIYSADVYDSLVSIGRSIADRYDICRLTHIKEVGV